MPRSVTAGGAGSLAYESSGGPSHPGDAGEMPAHRNSRELGSTVRYVALVKRIVTLVLVGPDGEVLGAREPFEAAVPWWQEVPGFGPDVQVLRLLHADRPEPPGGHVTYLAEVDGAAPVAGPAPAVDLGPHPKRAPYAEVGGPAASIAWATGLLPGTTAHQQRTWNLSAIWRLDDAGGRPVAWLKQVPHFFAHEPAAIRLLAGVAPGLVPELIADGEQGRMLLAHAPGEDRYEAGAELCAEIAAAFHPIQAHFAEHPEALSVLPDLRFGLPDAVQRFARVAEPHYATTPGLEKLIDDLPRRFAALAECGLPDTLVHGDLHPGNVRTDDAGRLTIMDWGDCTFGHPAFDILRLTGGLTDGDPLVADWAERWRRTVPGSDPERAVALFRPLFHLRGSMIYADFLANIEPSEYPYHAADVPACLARAASIVG